MRRETASLPPRYRLATGSLPPRYRLATANAVGFCVQTPSMRRIHARPSKFSRRHTLRLATANAVCVQTHPTRTKLSAYAYCTPEIE